MKKAIRAVAFILNLLQLGLILNFLLNNTTDNLPLIIFLGVVPLFNLVIFGLKNQS